MTKFLALFLKILITLPVICFLFFLTLSNRDQSLSLVWSPFSEASSIPLPMIIFLALAAGFVWGALILWSNTLQLRTERRAFKKRISVLENQLAQKQIDMEKMRSIKPSQELIP